MIWECYGFRNTVWMRTTFWSFDCLLLKKTGNVAEAQPDVGMKKSWSMCTQLAHFRNRCAYTYFGTCVEISIFGDVRMRGCVMHVCTAFSRSTGNLLWGSETFLVTAMQSCLSQKNSHQHNFRFQTLKEMHYDANHQEHYQCPSSAVACALFVNSVK